MKTKKIVIGAMAAAMLSLSVCSMIPASAAGETVQISVSNAKAKAGEKFTVEVSVADIPAAGMQACNFTLKYDPSVVTFTDEDIKAGTLITGITGDPSATMLPNFNEHVDAKEGTINFMWSTSVEDSTYWLKDGGVFCTVTGTVAAGAKSGETKIQIIPTVRETHSGSGVENDQIDCGYMKDGKKVGYEVSKTDGVITIGDDNPGTTAAGKTLKGDANCDGKVQIADATLILQYLANKDEYQLTDQGMINADVDGDPGVTAADALRIQQLDAGVITEL